MAPTDGVAASPQVDAQERRIAVMLDHALRTVVGVLLAVAVVMAWRTGQHPVASTAVAALMALAFLADRRVALVALVLLWAVGAWLSLGFAWVAFPLFFLVLHALPRTWAAVVVVAMTGWAVWCTGSFLGPVIGALAAVLGSTIFAVQRADAQTHRALVAELREAQESLAATERERGVLAERERLAREIHDTIGQGLASIVMLSRTAGPGALPLIESTARDNLTEARRLVRALGDGGGVGLVDGLTALVDQVRARAAASGSGLDVELRVEGAPPQPDPAVVAALHRGVQASLANVERHAGARRCVVGVSTFGDVVAVDVADDGVGFDPATVGPDSFGLRGLRARMAQVSGDVTVDTEPGAGTTIGLTAPLRAGSAAAHQETP